MTFFADYRNESSVNSHLLGLIPGLLTIPPHVSDTFSLVHIYSDTPHLTCARIIIFPLNSEWLVLQMDSYFWRNIKINTS